MRAVCSKIGRCTGRTARTPRSTPQLRSMVPPPWEFAPPAEFRPSAHHDRRRPGAPRRLGRHRPPLDAATGKLRGRRIRAAASLIRRPSGKGGPTSGSADGWVYCLEAQTGHLLWRFRAAPVERRIPVYGQLQSNWPVAGGTPVADGVVYVAAGIVNYDGTHLYALDALTGRVKWQNNTSGHLDPQQRSGVSVQGHLLLAGGKLYLPGGNVVSPGVYDLADGRCLNDPATLRELSHNDTATARGPRGNELYQVGGRSRWPEGPCMPIRTGRSTTRSSPTRSCWRHRKIARSCG